MKSVVKHHTSSSSPQLLQLAAVWCSSIQNWSTALYRASLPAIVRGWKGSCRTAAADRSGQLSPCHGRYSHRKWTWIVMRTAVGSFGHLDALQLDLALWRPEKFYSWAWVRCLYPLCFTLCTTLALRCSLWLWSLHPITSCVFTILDSNVLQVPHKSIMIND